MANKSKQQYLGQKRRDTNGAPAHTFMSTARMFTAVGTRYNSLRKHMQDSWWVEAVYLLAGVAALTSTACIIAVYDGKQLPQLQYGLTLNALISILGTIVRYTTSVPVAESLGQLKWTRYHNKNRKLSDFETYDVASRGPSGALYLIWNMHYRAPLATLAAVITVTSLAFGPFIQQIVTYPQLSISDPLQRASIARAQGYFGHARIGNGWDYLHSNMALAIQNGLLMDDVDMPSAPAFVCPSGNCTFPPFDSLAVCSICANVTNRTIKTTWTPEKIESGRKYDHFNFTFPSGAVTEVSDEFWYPAINFTDAYFDPTLYEPWNKTYGPDLGNIHDIILAFSVVQVPENQSTLDSYQATECALHLCVKTYHESTITSGKLEEHNQSSWYRKESSPFRFDGFNGHKLLPDRAAQGEEYRGNPFSIDVSSVQLFVRYIRQVMSLECQPTESPIMSSMEHTGCVPSILAQILASSSTVDWHRMMSALASSMTNAMRNDADESGSTSAPGYVYIQQVFVHADWAWFSLPIIVTVASAILVVTTVLENRRHDVPIWKTAALPVMLHGIKVEEGASIEKMSEMDALSKKTQAKMTTDVYGSRMLACVTS